MATFQVSKEMRNPKHRVFDKKCYFSIMLCKIKCEKGTFHGFLKIQKFQETCLLSVCFSYFMILVLFLYYLVFKSLQQKKFFAVM